MGGIIFSYIAPLIRFDFRILPPLQNNIPQIFRTIQPVIIRDIPVANPVVEISQPEWWTLYSFADILTVMLFAGMIIMLVRFIIQYLSLVFLKVSRKQKYKTYSILNTDMLIKPFSFGKRIYINPKLHDAKELDEIIKHELIHVHQYHSIDLIVATINRSIFWWNPFAWILSKDIRNNLEYIVDSEMLKYGFDRKRYQYHLLNISQLAYSNGMANYFNLSNLKTRIEMMNKEKTQSIHKMKWLLLIPVIAVILLSFNVKRAIAINMNFAVISEMIEPEETLNDEHSDSVADIKEAQQLQNLTDTIESKKTVRKNDNVVIVSHGTEKDSAHYVGLKKFESLSLAMKSNNDDAPANKWRQQKKLKISGNKIITKFNVATEVHDGSPKLSDLEEDSEIDFFIRGIYQDFNNPVFFIDGREAEKKEVQKLKSSEVESFSILENDYAIEKYGEKAKNGVILVTKKHNVFKNNEIVGVLSSTSEADTSTNLVQDGDFIIRGIYQGDSGNPLVFIDGRVAEKKEVQKLKSDEVESFCIIKEDDAIKKYGEQGKNGVILITKKGSSDNSVEKEGNKGFFIRGITNFGVDDKNKPLVLIDGVESNDDDLSRLSENDVISFSIMKDASTTDTYGERGANGVIVITTKKGEKKASKPETNSIGNINSVKHLDSPEIRELSENKIQNLISRAGNNSLYVINGKETDEKEMQKLNINDIDSLIILKDDAAIKVYGQKGKNGVVIVYHSKKTQSSNRVVKKYELFNRFGEKCLERETGSNWDGIANMGKDKGKKLPVGQYMFAETLDSGVVEKGGLAIAMDKSGKMIYIVDDIGQK
jgi:TonB-dependent SusC/RagA subfamily outer membrane receptor